MEWTYLYGLENLPGVLSELSPGKDYYKHLKSKTLIT